MKKGTFASLLALLLALSLTACGGSSMPSTAASGNTSLAQSWEAEAPAAMEAEDAYWDGGTNGSRDSGDSRSTLPDGVKMIYRANLELETTEFEQADSGVKRLTKELDGYFEEQSARTRSGGYRSASYTVRVPADRFEEFLEQIGNVCTVTYATQSAEDVSEYYYDMESRLETAKIKLDRLQDLLSKAEAMEDIITLESAISETEYQIEQLSGEKRHYDALIGYSTISVSLNEVYRVTEVESAPLTFGERMGIAFRDGLRNFGEGLEDFLEWLAYSWLSLLVFAAVVVIVVKIIKRFRVKRALSGEKREKRGWFGKKQKDAPTNVTEKKDE